jgi:hypothetical protein
MRPNATDLVREALAGSGVELVASCGVEAFDRRAPEGYQSAALMPGASGLVVAASAGPELWRYFREHAGASRSERESSHPFDRFVATILGRADRALLGAGVPFRRFDASFDAEPRMHFVAMGELVGLGSPGPFGMLIHSAHGPWWALRGAWLVRAEVDPPLVDNPPCVGCSAPCVGGWRNAGGVADATVEARARCVVGQDSRYDEEQIAYHYGGAPAKPGPQPSFGRQ